jgi:hypothetical protein
MTCSLAAHAPAPSSRSVAAAASRARAPPTPPLRPDGRMLGPPAGSRRGTSPIVKSGLNPALNRPVLALIWRNGTPLKAKAHIDAFGERHSHHLQFAATNAARTSFCDRVHRPPGPFSSIATGFV